LARTRENIAKTRRQFPVELLMHGDGRFWEEGRMREKEAQEAHEEEAPRKKEDVICRPRCL